MYRAIVKLLFFTFMWGGVLAQEVPYKPEDSFLLRVDMEFKSRPPADPDKYQVFETQAEYQKRTSATPLPYLYLYLTFTRLAPDEARFTVARGGKGFLNKKAELNKEIKLDLGFTDDIKDRTADWEYVVTLLSDKKKPVSRIVIYFSESGDYLVNGVKRGRI